MSFYPFATANLLIHTITSCYNQRGTSSSLVPPYIQPPRRANSALENQYESEIPKQHYISNVAPLLDFGYGLTSSELVRLNQA